MARVWVARQHDTHGEERLVAIKTILPKFASNERFREMFLREGGIASRLTHKNVARIFDQGEVGGTLYIAMEYLEGDSLSRLNQVCRAGGTFIPPAIVLRVLSDTCAGLQEAHELRDGTGRPLNVVHCDVGPANIFLTPKGTAKLLDFGVANAHVGASEETESAVLKGKTRYMSPEQAGGDPVDRRADVWAIGATMYHLLSGRPPYEGINVLATLRLIRAAAPPVPLPMGVPLDVVEIVRRCLARNPDDRYATAALLRDAIEDSMARSKLRATSADVAAFVTKQLSARMTERRRAVEAGLEARVPSTGVRPIAVASPARGSRAWMFIGVAALGVCAALAAAWSMIHP